MPQRERERERRPAARAFERAPRFWSLGGGLPGTCAEGRIEIPCGRCQASCDMRRSFGPPRDGRGSSLSRDRHLRLNPIKPDLTFLEDVDTTGRWSLQSRSSAPLCASPSATTFTGSSCSRSEVDFTFSFLWLHLEVNAMPHWAHPNSLFSTLPLLSPIAQGPSSWLNNVTLLVSEAGCRSVGRQPPIQIYSSAKPPERHWWHQLKGPPHE